MKLYHTWLEEHPEIDRIELHRRLQNHVMKIVDMEDRFIDLAFEMGAVEGLSADEVKAYVRYIANMRLRQLGMVEVFLVKDNPLPWLDHMLNGVRHTNFFEQRSTEYSKGATKGEWGDVDNW